MKTLNLTLASELKDAPTKAYLYRLVKIDNRPDYFYHDGDKWMIDIEHPTWLELLHNRAINGIPGHHKATVKNKPEEKQERIAEKHETLSEKQSKSIDKKIASMSQIDTGLDIADLKQMKLEAEVQEKKIKNEILYLTMQKQSGNIIDFSLAQYLFFSYMEKANIDFYRAARKNEAIIANFVKEGKVREIIQVVENECTAILKEIEKKQKEALDRWNEEEGRK
jgi:hypothetical protein